jgi:hypothetical protein
MLSLVNTKVTGILTDAGDEGNLKRAFILDRRRKNLLEDIHKKWLEENFGEGNVKSTSVIFLLIVLFLTGCEPSTVPTLPVGAVETAVAKTIASLPKTPKEIQSTNTVFPTYESVPTFSTVDLETLLRDNGYKRAPYVGSDNVQAFSWDNGTTTSFYTYPDSLIIEILDTPRDPEDRVDRMNKAVNIVASLFTPRFIADLKNEVEIYSRQNPSYSGEPKILDYGSGEFIGRLLEYNPKELELKNGSRNVYVELSINLQEYKCDPKLYEYCYFPSMPAITYSGDGSLAFFSVWIVYPSR